MIEFEEALELILHHSRRTKETTISLNEALGYFLAKPVVAKLPMPRFSSSAVDGYAVRISDLGGRPESNQTLLSVQGTIRAGMSSNGPLRRGHAFKILTGAPVPHGVDAIVMQEDVSFIDDKISIRSTVASGMNIRYAGEEFKKNEILLSPGTSITPPVIGILASQGISKVRVYRKPRIALLVTGDELRSLNKKLGVGDIYDSNSVMLDAALRSIGLKPIIRKRMRDTRKSISTALEYSLKRADVIISVGGISVGEFDLVKDVFEESKIKKIFWKVAMKPGKPFLFGTLRNRLIFGLPGNPVSALLTFKLLIQPALLKMIGCSDKVEHSLRARLMGDLKKKPGRKEFVRGKTMIDQNGTISVAPTRGQDSHMLGGMANADCLIQFPAEAEYLESGTQVTITPLLWREMTK